MPGLVPGIHVFGPVKKSWMAGTSPAMTSPMDCRITCPARDGSPSLPYGKITSP